MRFLFISIFLSSFAQASDCDFKPTILKKAKGGYTATWSIAEEPSLFLPFGSVDRRLQQYVKWVRAHTSLEARAMMKNHFEVGAKLLEELSDDPSNGPFRQSLERDQRNTLQIIDGKLGRFRALTCLESIPFREFLKVLDLRKSAQEFNATILKKAGQITIIGDFFPGNKSTQGGTVESQAAAAHRLKLQKDGWELFSHFHNHPFVFKNPNGDFGGIGPSEPDVERYRQLLPKTALITDGLETFELDQSEFGKFEI